MLPAGGEMPTFSDSFIGGGIVKENGGLTNVTLSGNQTAKDGGIYIDYTNVRIKITNSLIEGSVNSMPTSEGDYRLKDGSPAIDAGFTTLYHMDTNYDVGVDLAGGLCVVNGKIDMGAYQYSASNGVRPKAKVCWNV